MVTRLSFSHFIIRILSPVFFYPPSAVLRHPVRQSPGSLVHDGAKRKRENNKKTVAELFCASSRSQTLPARLHGIASLANPTPHPRVLRVRFASFFFRLRKWGGCEQCTFQSEPYMGYVGMCGTKDMVSQSFLS